MLDPLVPIWLEEEAAAIAARLAPLLGVEPRAIQDALRATFECYRKPNAVSLLATAEHLAALLAQAEDAERHRERVLGGEFGSVTGELCEELAGPAAVDWDSNWPPEVARLALRDRLPPGAKPGDIVIGGDGGGTRIDIRVVADDDGVLTGDVLFPETWRDPPLEDVWVAAYSRLEAAYPDAIPPLL